MISLQSAELFQGKHVSVRYNEGVSDTVFVTFTSVGINTVGFAENYFKSRKISAIHFLSKWDHWWQPGEIRQAVDTAAQFLSSLRQQRPYLRVVAYGASMGAYGAALYARLLGAQLAVLIAPQFSIDPLKPPFEHRWKREAAGIEFEYDDMAQALDPRIRWSIVHDPLSEDLPHTNLFARHVPLLSAPVVFGGHTPALVLQQAGLLEHFLHNVLAGIFNGQEFRRQLGSARRRSWAFWVELAEKAAARRPHLTLYALQQAVDKKPKSSRPFSLLSTFYMKQGQWAEAIQWGERAVAEDDSATDNAAPQRGANAYNHLAGLYMHARNLDAAEHCSKMALRKDPRKALFSRRLSHILLQKRDIKGAIKIGEEALAIDVRDAASYLHLSGVFESAREFEAARSVLEKGIEHLPQHPGIRSAIEKLKQRETAKFQV